MRWTIRRLVLALALPLAAGAAFKMWLGTGPASVAGPLGALLVGWFAIQQILTLRETQLAISSIRLETEFGADVPPVQGDSHQLQQVFLNLILNAGQAILGSGVGGRRSGDSIRVSTRARHERDRAWVVAQVADNGPGIPAEVLPRIFEPFFTTKKVGEGAELGLSVSYGIVEEHGGRLSVESGPGRACSRSSCRPPRR
jgi:signal transduction histidine kinase